ncbi:hypothetical protein AQUCO_03300130v1 [Aquilegia coerulea]|uniref:Uncharacterized protein n=1 Tax=Aquilegia coerulea TaxID=218851 RepID=A0A2G5CZL1_AQUCA|nr:hypothetical protein AQUCO_03300130v1 [Aquilegia coerulea]
MVYRPTVAQHSMDKATACSSLIDGENIVPTSIAAVNSPSKDKNQYGPSKRSLAQQTRREREKNGSVTPSVITPRRLSALPQQNSTM